MKFIDKLLSQGIEIDRSPITTADNGNWYYIKFVKYTNGVMFFIAYENGEPFDYWAL